jgi:hypothetical protein
MSALNWICIYDRLVPGIAHVGVYEKEYPDSLGRYTVAKTMRLANGKFRTIQTYYVQKAAAIRYADKWLKAREEILKVGKS